ncbi:MAG: phosphomannomutase [Gammaproteobacteria bacterium]|nr:phosphomannomutase [Gammaproteobacteria bacterium]
MRISCFKAYDIRGRVPDQLNEEIAFHIGRAYASFLQPKRVVVGFDIRLTSEALCNALTRGLVDAGVEVLNIGRCGTEEIYFATSHLKTDGGIVVTASHNPKDYNGMKLVREESRPISADTGLTNIRTMAEAGHIQPTVQTGSVHQANIRAEYIMHLLSYVNIGTLKPLKIVCNAGNGGAGPIIDLLEQHLPFEFIKLHHEPDGNFPHGVPNPMLVENRAPTIDAIIREGADIGLAWDGDFDRCFFFDEAGNFIEGYYIVGLLARTFLEKHGGGKVVHDPRLIWNTLEIARSLGGETVQSKSGHAFIKECMRQEDALYGGEMSAHHYFRDFFYCDSGMVPWLLILELMCTQESSLSELVAERMQAFPVSGEINHTVGDPRALLKFIETRYGASADNVDYTDGLSVGFPDWRFNLRMSNTEPVVRLNVEARGDKALMQAKTEELLTLIRSQEVY